MSYMTKAPNELPVGFDTWNEYLAYLINTPLKQRWYRWNLNYRIALRSVIAEVKAKA